MDNVVVFNIDGLRADVFDSLLSGSEFLKDLFVAPRVNCKSTFPSITFAAQATIATGEPPDRHGIPGNQFFDRLGIYTNGIPEFYALDVARGVRALKSAKVFLEPGEANRLLSEEVQTMYEAVGSKTSLCCYNMYSRGANYWIRPTLLEMWLLKKFSLRWFPPIFEKLMTKRLLNFLSRSSLPSLLTVYFMSLDTVSHRDGPSVQKNYYLDVIEPELKKIYQAVRKRAKKTVFILVSDHGSVEVKESYPAIGAIRDDIPLVEALREKGKLSFKGSKLIFANNAGMGQLYIRDGEWGSVPSKEIVERFATDAKDSSVFSGVFVRDSSTLGFDGPYRALVGEMPNVNYGSSLTGDIILIPDTSKGVTFGDPVKGNHGGISNDEMECVLAFSAPNAQGELAEIIKNVEGKFTEDPPQSELEYVRWIVEEGLGRG